MAKNIKITTPKGTAKFPWLNKADTKFDELGEYKVTLVMSKKDAAPFITAVEKAFKEYKATEKFKKSAPLPWGDEVDDQGNKTGNVAIRLKTKNKRNKDGDLWDRKPALFDAKGNKINVAVGGGSVIKVATELYFWNNPSTGIGVSLQPTAVQILELVERETGSAKSYGFDEEEGFTADRDEVAFENDVEEKHVAEDATSEDEDLY